MADDKDTVERVKEILVYGPIGLALYMRDTAPSFLKVFVARGRAELDDRKRTVGSHLGQARTVGQDAVDQTAAGGGADQVLRMLAGGLGKVRGTAEGAWGALGARGADFAAPPRPTGDTARSETAARAPSGAGPSGRGGPSLAIPDYDELSASQVVDRLEGLTPEGLGAIRAYESAHRGRATILGKVDQLTDPG